MVYAADQLTEENIKTHFRAKGNRNYEINPDECHFYYQQRQKYLNREKRAQF